MSKRLSRANRWFASLPFHEIEKITKIRQGSFSPEDGYSDFVNACDEWWEELSPKEKIYLWRTHFH